MRARNALVWTLVSLSMVCLVIGLAYGLAGFVDYPTLELVSGLAPISALGGWRARDEGGDGDDAAAVSAGISDTPPGAPRSSCILPGAGVPGVAADPASKLNDGLVRGPRDVPLAVQDASSSHAAKHAPSSPIHRPPPPPNHPTPPHPP